MIMPPLKGKARFLQFVFGVFAITVANLVVDMSVWQWIAAAVTFGAIEMFGLLIAPNEPDPLRR